jgi:hypothetical protein
MTAAIVLVADLTAGRTAAVAGAAALLLGFAVLWLCAPLRIRHATTGGTHLPNQGEGTSRQKTEGPEPLRHRDLDPKGPHR